MFQKTDLSASARFSISSLLTFLAIALSGCSGLHVGGGSELSRAVTGGYGGGESLAVLLPESGRFAGAAQVVRDGIVAAREADPQGRRPTLRFYDSAAGSIAGSLRQAAADGATLAIGPLQKPAVAKLASSSELPIPVLALNQAPAGRATPGNLYQFALSPEGEASQVAEKAWREGHSSALMLYPEGNWGSRISRAFRQQWKSLGGILAATQAYDPSAQDFADTIARLSDRAARADMAFLVATPKLAREIWPRMRREIGREMPVYSTSHIYSGRFDPQGDQRLVGLNFVEIPWLVEPDRGDAVSSRGLRNKLPRLYAMGVDAYRLGSRLGWLWNDPQARVLGKTGILSMDSRRRIHRELVLARIEDRGPVRIAAADAPQTQGFAGRISLREARPLLDTVGFPDLAAVAH